MQLMTAEGQGLDRDTIESILSEKIVGLTHVYHYKHLFQLVTVFFKKLAPAGAKITQMFKTYYLDIE